MVMRSPNHRVVRTDGTRACYEIRNTDHTLVARHIRIDLAKGKKTFTWELPDGTKRLSGRSVKTLPFYRSETLKALPPGSMVFVCEGEKATDAAVAMEFDAVGTVTGLSSLPNDAVLRTLDGFHVIAWPDCRRGRPQAHGPAAGGVCSAPRRWLRAPGSRWWTRHGWG